jgi:hypothetical protein
VVAEGPLEARQVAVGCQAFDGDDPASVDSSHWHHARLDDPPIQEHGAGTAIAGIAANFGSCEAKTVAQYLGEASQRRPLHLYYGSVDLERN